MDAMLPSERRSPRMRPPSRSRVRYVILCIAAAAILVPFWRNEIPRSFDGERPNDFPNYYLGGRRLLEDRPVYAPLEEEVRLRLGWSGYPTNVADPPFLVAVLSPLSTLPYRTAWWIFVLVGIAVLVAAPVAIGLALGFSTGRIITHAFVFLACIHARYLVAFNHMEWILLALLTAGWLGLREDRCPAWASLWGVAAAMKLFPALLILACALAKRWREFAWAVSAFLACSLSGAFAVGIGDTEDFLFRVIPGARRWLGHPDNVSLLSIASRTLPPPGAALTVAAAAVAAGALLWRVRRSFDRLFGLSVVFSLMLSPLCWMGYLVLVLPSIMIAEASLDLSVRPWGLVFAFAVFLAGFTAPWPAGSASDSAPWIFAVLPLLGLVLVAALLEMRHGAPVPVDHGLGLPLR